MKNAIPLWTPELPPEVSANIAVAISAGMIGPGPLVKQLERELAERFGCSHCVCTSSGSAALHVLFHVLADAVGIDPTAVVPEYGYFAAAEALLCEGWQVESLDVAKGGATLDPEEFDRFDPTAFDAAVFIRHNGSTIGLEEVVDALDGDVFLVEDMACSIGPAHVKLLGDAGILSFAATKWVTCGQGGAILTSHTDIARRVREYCDHGGSEWRVTRRGVSLGNNLRLDDIRAAMILAQLPGANDRWAEYRAAYDIAMNSSGVPVAVGWMPQALFNSGAATDQFVSRMQDRGITCAKLYPVVSSNLWWKSGSIVPRELCTVASQYADCSVFLPSGPGLSQEQIGRISSIAKEVIREMVHAAEN